MTETFNTQEAIKAQRKLCNDNKYPHFAPSSGVCWSCNRQIYETISVERAGKSLVTGCPRCGRTYCD